MSKQTECDDRFVPLAGGTDFAAPFALGRVPEMVFGAGECRGVASHAAALCGSGDARTAMLVVDAGLAELGLARPLADDLNQAGLRTVVFDRVAGEPKAARIDEASELARRSGAGLVIGMGGGSALDIAKSVASIATADADAMHYACGNNPLPKSVLPKICLPTTAGTGSEMSRTNVFSGPDGRKVWIWDDITKPDLVVLDPELTLSLPPDLTAWTGLDALTHALEACTNKRRFAAADIYAHLALTLNSRALPAAVADGGDSPARGHMLLGSAYAGTAIDNCGTAIAHNISHALAALAPVHHGLATALALEATLAWSVAEDDGPFDRAARACGLESADRLPAWFSGLLDA